MSEHATVLLVGDISPLETINDVLQSLGCWVRRVRSGIEALESTRAALPDVVIVATELPGLSGYQLCRSFKRDESTRLIPVMLVGAGAGGGDRIAGIEAGCDDFLACPVDPAELSARVRTLSRLSYAGLRRREQDVLAHVVEDLDDGLIIAGEDGEVVLANQRAWALLDTGPRLGSRFCGLLTARHQCSPALTWEDLRDVEAHTFSVERPDTARSPAGWLQIAVRRVQPSHASIAARYVITLRDITGEVMAQYRPAPRRLHDAGGHDPVPGIRPVTGYAAMTSLHAARIA